MAAKAAVPDWRLLVDQFSDEWPFNVRTSEAELKRLRNLRDNETWSLFKTTYVPMFEAWGRMHRLSAADIDELVQRVLVRLVEFLPRFCYDPERGSFRGLLFVIVRNVVSDMLKERGRLDAGTGNSAVLELLQQQPETILHFSASTEYRTDRFDDLIQALAEVRTACLSEGGEGGTATEDAGLSWSLFERHWVQIPAVGLRELADGSGLTYFGVAGRIKRIIKKVKERAEQIARARLS